MTKTILTKIDGFTPLPDLIVNKYGVITAAVWGSTWRYCQMSDGVCRASLEKIAKRIGVSRQTVITHLEILVKDKFFEDTTPQLKNKPHIYRDTGKVAMYNRFGIGVNEIDSGVNLIDSGVNEIDSESQSNLLEDSIKIDLKESKKKKNATAFYHSSYESNARLGKAQAVLEKASGLVAIPSGMIDRLDTIYQLIDTYGEDEALTALQDARSAWVGTRRKDNSGNYSVLNPAWIDWAVAHLAGETPWKQSKNKHAKELEFLNG